MTDQPELPEDERPEDAETPEADAGKVVATYLVPVTVRETEVGARAGVDVPTNSDVASVVEHAIESLIGASRVGSYARVKARATRTDK